jgi:NADH dehydrogenase (ubiquinone) Fe-S protein 1
LFVQVLAKSKKPIIILGSASLQRSDAAALFSLVSRISQQVRLQSDCGEDWRVLNILHRVCWIKRGKKKFFLKIINFI